jgi:chemotaxis protein MotB
VIRRFAGALVLALVGCAARSDMEENKGLVGQLEKEIMACREMTKLYRDRAETCSDTSKGDVIYTELAQVLSGDDNVVLAHKGPVTTLTLPETHLFGSDNFSVRLEAKKTLDLMATALNLHPTHTILVEGHTADLPIAALQKKWPTIWEQSYYRARQVMDVLVDDYHVERERFTIAGRAGNQPIDSNDTPVGSQRNRRVVVHVYPQGAQK